MSITQYSILVADDEPANIEIYFKSLNSEQYQLLVAPNGQICYDVARQTKPALIIMDWEMPVMDGIEAVKKLQQDNETKNIPVIMATGKMTSSENLKTALDAGAVDYLRKPIDKIELMARVRSMLSLYESLKKNIEQERLISKQKEEQLMQIINQNKKELTSNTLRLVQNSEFNMQLIDDIKEIAQYTNPEGKKYIKDIIIKHKVNSSQSNWQEFEILFEQVHSDFYKSLNENFPDLTPNERKLCAFLKLNMTSKDISSITFQTTESLKKARFRLRKKLNIDGAENISTFLQRF